MTGSDFCERRVCSAYLFSVRKVNCYCFEIAKLPISGETSKSHLHCLFLLLQSQLSSNLPLWVLVTFSLSKELLDERLLVAVTSAREGSQASSVSHLVVFFQPFSRGLFCSPRRSTKVNRSIRLWTSSSIHTTLSNWLLVSSTSGEVAAQTVDAHQAQDDVFVEDLLSGDSV